MEEFLIKNYTIITHSVEILSALTGLLLYRKYKLIAAKFFIWFLVYLSLCDFIGGYVNYIADNDIFSYLKDTVFSRNFWWTTLYWKIGAILFFVFYYNKILKTEVFKIVIKYCCYLFLVFSIIYIIFNWNDYFIRFFPIISVLGAIIIFICTVFYFVEMLQSDRTLTFYKSIDFYISVAIFIWWLIITPIVFYDIYGEYRDINYIHLRRYIYLSANVIMYLTFTFALIFCKPDNEINMIN
ncbi:hypothetical protein SAMN05428642_10438 [Flaviramulus basaltis]|uniref:Bacteriorhodopsin n=1 Tax=Flaviramulus basaltis TaxID=369401 RepID=A0A1K2IPZ6_9FLAO|nr:hypothetical protein [Flaviramulus basaltis]SFZ94272.1 hypothetical protein SAMN05428642_10438 [Flaviramulus basaltis]